jgi:hypothetical protein
MILLASLLAISFFSVLSHADEFSVSKLRCREAHFESRFGSVRDQGTDKDCFAFAAADLLGEELGLVPPDKVSALDIANRWPSALAVGLPRRSVGSSMISKCALKARFPRRL